jgi:hypothetical protein
MQRPALVTEVPLELTADARHRVRAQAAADGRIEIADRFHQADVPHLHQVLSRHRTSQVTPHAGPDQAVIPGNQQVKRHRPPLAAPRQRTHQLKQRAVIKRGQFRPGRQALRGPPTKNEVPDRHCCQYTCCHASLGSSTADRNHRVWGSQARILARTGRR